MHYLGTFLTARGNIEAITWLEDEPWCARKVGAEYHCFLPPELPDERWEELNDRLFFAARRMGVVVTTERFTERERPAPGYSLPRMCPGNTPAYARTATGKWF